MEQDLKLARGFTTLDIQGSRKPHVIADFTLAPFKSDQFKLILFDPPHLTAFGSDENIAKFGRHPLEQRYGAFKDVGNMRKQLYLAFREIGRMLAPDGLCIFKWNTYIKPLEWALSLAPQSLLVQKKTLIGQRRNRTRNQKTFFVELARK